MGSMFLTHLPSAWHVDQAILAEETHLVVIRFGSDANPECMTMIPDFNAMYELYDACTVMFFWRNKHIQVDFGTGNNNKINFALGDKQELVDILEVAYKAASKGKGLAVSPRDYSTKWNY
ncbi:spliceosomal protein DIB1 [Parastagonospora nodorum]|nr:spliceosomal protein DIB1 [Parastagonospora nodorum]KAH4924600.1 spliceosomal protein DIB1 [Parastagonospora nodorum]KAH5277103.1 spliceosomal protein DIB1 [Parastagonospora nodorum]KAH5345642.1 spliceosomal protein DIB1 [Parastagonospora nodorum]KAH5508914.1 spliceosomal protein DIB1 [Parastagonospora nodorum]